MNRILLVLASAILFTINGRAQNTAGTGKPVMQIITDLHLDLNDTSKTSGFGISRAYLGYEYQATGNFSCRMVLNIGSPEDLPKPSASKRYAFFREASVRYTGEKVIVSFGLTTTRHFDFLQKFWDKRFIASEFEVRNRYGYIADLGVVVDYLVNDNLSLDFSLTNGEGYSEIQLDNGFKGATGVTWKPGKGCVFRFYNDLNSNLGVLQYTASAFAGVDNRYVNFGTSFHYKTRYDRAPGHDVWGISATGSVKLPENFEIFGRYDYSGSVKARNELTSWNYAKDATFAIFGVQRTFSPNFRLAIDFQDTIPYPAAMSSSGFIFLNALFKI